jgi:protein deglycase
MDSLNKPIAAICAAPLVLQHAGILGKRSVTCHPSVHDALKGGSYQNERVVMDGNIITSQAPGTAMEFSLKLVEVLFDDERRNVVNKGVLAKL